MGARLEARRPEVVSIVIVGDEILAGEVRDENLSHLTRALAGEGIRIHEARVIPDRHQRIVDVLREEIERSDAVVVTGGIGPTHDDLTRAAVADVAEVPIERHQLAERQLRQGFGDSVTLSELTMADLPRGAELLIGRVTPAFGFRVGSIFVLPGVPFYLEDIFAPLLAAWHGEEVARHEVLSRLREGKLADGLTAIQDANPEVAIGSYPICEDGYLVRVVIRSRDEEAAARVERAVRELVERSGA